MKPQLKHRDWPGLVNFFRKVHCLEKLILTIYLRILEVDVYSDATMILRIAKLILNFTMSSFSGWVDFRASFSTNPLTFESIIWNNKDIKIDGKPIYYPKYVNAGILFCYHLQFDNNNNNNNNNTNNNNNLHAYNNAIDAGLRNTNFFRVDRGTKCDSCPPESYKS